MPVDFILDTSLTAEAYRIEPLKTKINVYGGDGTGLLSGGFEVAEQIELSQSVTTAKGKPYLAKRGLKFNIPLNPVLQAMMILMVEQIVKHAGRSIVIALLPRYFSIRSQITQDFFHPLSI